jgi:hypothetical protein
MLLGGAGRRRAAWQNLVAGTLTGDFDPRSAPSTLGGQGLHKGSKWGSARIRGASAQGCATS